MNCSTSEKADDLIEFAVYLGALHAQDGAVHVDVLAAGQFGMEAGADFQEGANPSAHSDRSTGRFGNAREDFEQGRFARAVASHDAQYLAFFHVERNVFQGPNEVLLSLALCSSCQRFGKPHGSIDGIHQHIAQHVVAELRLRRADAVSLAEVVYGNSNGHDYIVSANVFSMLRK
jgi:hypothetical protein